MDLSDTISPVIRLTLGLKRQKTRRPTTPTRVSDIALETGYYPLDRRKKQRIDSHTGTDDGDFDIPTPGTTPFPSEPPLLGSRYLPLSVAGDGAFSRTILAQDMIHPCRPIVAIKAMKPGFNAIGQQEYKLLRRLQNIPLPKLTTLPIVRASSSFTASSTFHIVLEALDSSVITIPECPCHPQRHSPPRCPYRQNVLRKVAAQLLVGLALLHDQAGYIHADLKPENVLRCVSPSDHSMKVKLIDLGNAVPIDSTDAYYDDFEVQSVHYRAPEVFLGIPFTTSIDIFSLGIILVELLLASSKPQYEQFPQATEPPLFPSSPPQSDSPVPLNHTPLLATLNPSRKSFIEQLTRLFGPLNPEIYRRGKFWSEDFADARFIEDNFQVGISLKDHLESEGLDVELIDFLMRMLDLDPLRRISAREALCHNWIVGPLLGYWAVLGINWPPQLSPIIETRAILWQEQNVLNSLERSQEEHHICPSMEEKEETDIMVPKIEEESDDEVKQIEFSDEIGTLGDDRKIHSTVKLELISPISWFKYEFSEGEQDDEDVVLV